MKFKILKIFWATATTALERLLRQTAAHLGVPLSEHVDELAVDRELPAAGLGHLHVGAVEAKVGGVVSAHKTWLFLHIHISNLNITIILAGNATYVVIERQPVWEKYF